MIVQKFNTDNFKDLCIVLALFDVAFPDLQEHFDRLFYYIFVKTDVINQTFAEFRQTNIETRKNRMVSADVTYEQLTILCFSLAFLLKILAETFPDIAIHSDRVLYEVRIALGNNLEPFEVFHKTNQMCRQVVNTKVKGVG